MKKSTIQFNIDLDQNNVPERIHWDATDKPQDTPSAATLLLVFPEPWLRSLVFSMALRLASDGFPV